MTNEQNTRELEKGVESSLHHDFNNKLENIQSNHHQQNTDSSKPGSPKQQVPKVEANGHVKSPMKIPDLNKNDKGTPSKSLSPKTPDSVTSIGGDKKKVPMNKVQVGAAPSPNLKVVRSKIGSLGNSSYKPGGGKVKIENRKLDWKAEARIEAKNQAYAPKGGDKKIPNVKLQWNAKPKIGSLENATYKPGGGDKKIESVKLDFKEKAKPKVGSKDNLKHTPGGGTVKKSVDSDGRNKTIDIEEQKLDIKAQSKIGSMENVKHKPGGGDKKIFDDKDYLRQKSATSESSRGSSEVLSGTQDLMDGIEKLNLLPEIDESLENNEEKTPQTNVSFSLQRTLESSLVIAEQANNKLNEVKKMEMAKKMEPLKKAQKSEEDDQSNLPNQITKDDKDSKNKDLGAKEGSGLEGKLTEPQDTKKITKDEKEQEVEKGETGMTVEKPGREGTIKESGTEDMGRSDKEENKKVSENEENVGSVEKSEKLDKLEYGVLQKENKSEKKEIVGEKVEKQELGKEKDAKAAEKEIGKDDEKSEFDKNGLVETSIPEFHAGTTEEIEPTEKEINPFVKSLKTIRSPELTLKEVEEKSKFQDSGKSETLKPEKEDIQQQNQEVDLKKTLNPIVGGDLVIFGPKPLPQETSKIELEKKEDLNESSLKVKKGLNGKVEKSESGKTELAEKKKSEELNWHSEDQKEEHESEKDTKKSKEVQESILNSNILKEPSQHEKL